jgi:nucleotide-binding universal stress UspA family protein
MGNTVPLVRLDIYRIYICKLNLGFLRFWMKRKKSVRAKKGIKAQTKIVVRRPADQILKFAEKEKIDLIVIGSTRLKGLARVRALGSVSRNVAAKAPCPVLTVR